MNKQKEQSKRISASWNGLSDKGREEWNDKVAKAKKEYEQYLEDNPEIKKLLLLQQENKKRNKSNGDISFPLGTIKKIILKDPDVNRISKESIVLINHATKLFIEKVVNQTNDEQMILRGAKTLTEKDMVNLLHSSGKYMFLRHVFKKDKNTILGVKRKSNHNGNTEPPKKKMKHNANVNNGNTITQFFEKK